MTENIRSIFEQNIRLLKGLDKTLYYSREQQYDKALASLGDSADLMKNAIEAIIQDQEYFNLVSTDTVLEMLSGILNAWRKRDYILLADLLELQMVSFLCGVQEMIIRKEEIEFNEEKYLENIRALQRNGEGFEGLDLEMIQPEQLLDSGYRVEFTSCGLMTLAAENGGSQFYFHTNNRIYSESILLVDHWYREGTLKYVLYGFGMGYHIGELKDLAPDSEIEIYEADLNVIKLASAFNDTKDVLNKNKVKLIYDPDFTKLKLRLERITIDERFLIHYPSFQNIRSKEGRELMESYLPWSKTLETC